MDIKITQLFIYPIKGLPGISVQTSLLTKRGLQYDRRWMLVDENGRFLSQRGLPILSQFKVLKGEQEFIIEAPHKQSILTIPFQIFGSAMQVQVWEDTCLAYHFSEEADRWFSEILAQKCSLVYMPELSVREIPNSNQIASGMVSFADAYPLLLIGQASLNKLNSLLAEPIRMDRFRPNMVLDGTTAFEEDTFFEFTIGNNSFIAAKPCARCSVISINQQSGEIGHEPLKTLSTFRQKDNKIYFGENALCTAGFHEISVGNKISILSHKMGL
ncbi:MAG: MOSC domain-containing protein [Bacteroidia bacterium]